MYIFIGIYILMSFLMGNCTKLNGYQLWLSSQYWQRSFNQLLKVSDITHAQYMVLSYMVWADKKQKLMSMSQNQLAQELNLDAMMISNVLKALENKQWIIRMPAEKVEQAKKDLQSDAVETKQTKDKKKSKGKVAITGNVLSVTDQGKGLIKALSDEVMAFEDKVFAKVNKKFKKHLSTIVEQLSQ